MASKTVKRSIREHSGSRRSTITPVKRATNPVTRMLADDFAHIGPDEQLNLVQREYEAAYEALNEGRLIDHAGQYVAFCNGAMVGCGAEPERLRDQVSKELGVHRERMAVIHVKDRVIL